MIRRTANMRNISVGVLFICFSDTPGLLTPASVHTFEASSTENTPINSSRTESLATLREETSPSRETPY